MSRVFFLNYYSGFKKIYVKFRSSHGKRIRKLLIFTVYIVQAVQYEESHLKNLYTMKDGKDNIE